jgi:hypothetical protein
MKNLDKHLVTVGLVATGVVVAGFVLNQFASVGFIANARSGYRA